MQLASSVRLSQKPFVSKTKSTTGRLMSGFGLYPFILLRFINWVQFSPGEICALSRTTWSKVSSRTKHLRRRASLPLAVVQRYLGSPLQRAAGTSTWYWRHMVGRTYVRWGEYIEKLRNEWQEYVAFVSWSTFITPHGREDSHHPPQSTILLNANIAFLAVPNVIQQSTKNSTSAQLLSYVSVITSLCSIIVGLLLLR